MCFPNIFHSGISKSIAPKLATRTGKNGTKKLAIPADTRAATIGPSGSLSKPVDKNHFFETK
jgi:hypothetical protein